ncbi:amino acid transporter [Aequorivita sublithincola DSM 14238]|uniref:Amino acid transporter n=1 Tax=Aequorivita sublithincola (strain DSM 14238 / LMG 21431 / ACAM 643 / 9-3) TaxID=746697 RepID=I3YSZ3_AEQSU|nr:APC family permease [Aequorivita sublithincola]AFL80111.1 amino acid transporter [Aequorivita sublithincola DSM 14238]
MKKKKSNDSIQLKDAIAIGIGGMVGGGIFAVLGLAVSLAKGGTPLAFLFAGIIALFTAYSYSKLSLSFPDKGGTVRFVNEGFGKGIFSGGINNVLWISYIIMLSLYATAFGSYAPNLISITGSKSVDTHIFVSGVILIATLINYYSLKIVGKIESIAVFIKLFILIAFAGLGIYGLFGNPNVSQLNPSNWENPFLLLTGGMVIFVAYEGFELIANAVPNLKNPKKNVPRAYFISVGFVVLLYIVIAMVTVGSLGFDKIATAKDYVLAAAAKPMIGQLGFTIMTIAALISTFSAINATVYGGSRVSYELAEDDELPHSFTDQFWNKPIGLVITVILTLLTANLLNLESISTSGSAGFLLIFAVVNYVAYKKAKTINAYKTITLIGAILCALAFIVLIVQQSGNNLLGVAISLGIILICFVIEWIFKTYTSKSNK